MPNRAGHVTLVGAGPGDAELLTLKAVRALQAADVVLYDDLVSTDVIELARREAKRMTVGKRGQRELSAGGHQPTHDQARTSGQACRSPQIRRSNDLRTCGRRNRRTRKARHRRHGRARHHGGAGGCFRTRHFADPSRHAHSVRFVTGHARNGELSNDLDWRGLADPRTTLVFYMGGRTAPAIADRLIAAGLPAATPVVVTSGVSRPDEK